METFKYLFEYATDLIKKGDKNGDMGVTAAGFIMLFMMFILVVIIIIGVFDVVDSLFEMIIAIIDNFSGGEFDDQNLNM